MPDREKVEECIMKVVSEQYYSSAEDNEAAEITLNTDIRKDLKFDSIMLVVLQIEIEDTFCIRFNPSEVDMRRVFTTIQAVSDYVQSVLRNENEQQ